MQSGLFLKKWSQFVPWVGRPVDPPHHTGYPAGDETTAWSVRETGPPPVSVDRVNIPPPTSPTSSPTWTSPRRSTWTSLVDPGTWRLGDLWPAGWCPPIACLVSRCPPPPASRLLYCSVPLFLHWRCPVLLVVCWVLPQMPIKINMAPIWLKPLSTFFKFIAMHYFHGRFKCCQNYVNICFPKLYWTLFFKWKLNNDQ